MNVSPLDPIIEQLAVHAAWRVWVVEYGMTHHRMVLAVHPGTYPRAARVELSDCLYFSGDLQGGPYTLTLTEVDYHGQTLWEIRSGDSSFRVVFGAARLLQALPE